MEETGTFKEICLADSVEEVGLQMNKGMVKCLLLLDGKNIVDEALNKGIYEVCLIYHTRIH